MRILFLLVATITSTCAQVPGVEAYVMADDFAEAMLEGDELFAGCSLACAYGWTTHASSVLGSQGGNDYSEQQLHDNRARTAWVEGVEGQGEAEWLKLTVVGNGDSEEPPTSFWGIDIVNGYAKDEATWEANSRVKTMALLLNGNEVCTIELVNTHLPQTVDLGDLSLEVAPGTEITLQILSVYPGSMYEDTAISEINLMGAH